MYVDLLCYSIHHRYTLVTNERCPLPPLLYSPSPVLSMLGIALVKRDNNHQDRGRGSGGGNHGNEHLKQDPYSNPGSSSVPSSSFDLGSSPSSGTSPDSSPVPGAGRLRPMELGAVAVVVSFLVIRAAETALRVSREQHNNHNHNHNHHNHSHNQSNNHSRRGGGGWWSTLSAHLTSTLTGIHPTGPSLPLPPALSSLPPPAPPRGAKGCVVPPRNTSLCPLCRRTRQMAVVTTGRTSLYSSPTPCLYLYLCTFLFCPYCSLKMYIHHTN